MTRDDVIRMAREAGLGEPVNHDQWDADLPRLERFAQLVETAVNARANASWTLMCEKMVAAEREACAKLCDFLPVTIDGTLFPEQYAAAIRARGQQ